MAQKYNFITIGDADVFYRTAGTLENPAILLLHGFPSSSHQYRELIPLLAKDFYVVAPDFQGFGQTRAPGRDKFEYTFEHIADIVDTFTEKIGLRRFAMY